MYDSFGGSDDGIGTWGGNGGPRINVESSNKARSKLEQA